MSDEWLCRNVTPRISAAFDDQVGAILARPLLWAVFNPEQAERVHASQRRRIVSEFIKLERELGDNDNPIEKVTVVASEGSSSDFPCPVAPDYHHFFLTKVAVPLLCSWWAGDS